LLGESDIIHGIFTRTQTHVGTGRRHRYSRIHISTQIWLGYYVNCRYNWMGPVQHWYSFVSSALYVNSLRERDATLMIVPGQNVASFSRPEKGVIDYNEAERWRWNKGNALFHGAEL